MELKYRVTLNGTMLNQVPQGLDKLTTEFIRDNEIFGIYVVSSFDLVFIGDGYCLLRDIQNDLSVCDVTILVEERCRGVYKTKFNGIIEVGTIKINESAETATCEIQDNSPLALISRNADVTIDLHSDKSIYNTIITPASFGVTNLSSPTATGVYAADYTTWAQAIRVCLEGITGVPVNVSSTFLTTVPQPCVYTIQYVGDLTQIIDSTIVVKNFQGVTQTVIANVTTGNSHLAEMAKRLLSSTTYIANDLTGISNTLQYNDDFRNFYDSSVNVGTKTITVTSNLPIEIISATATALIGVITITVTKTQEYSDGGYNPILLNHRSLKKQTGVYNAYHFTTSFRELMELLNHEYNVLFLATYNSSGEIDIRIEDYQTIANATINYTFDNVKNLQIEFDEDIASKQIEVGDGQSRTLATKNYTFSTDSCGIGNDFDAKSDFIIGSVQIYQDLNSAYDDDLEDRKYLLENVGATTLVRWTDDNYVSLGTYTGNVYNLYLTNWHKIYRHLNKFRNNVIGVAPYYDFDVFDYNVNIENIALNKLFRNYTFDTIMTEAQFNALSDNVFDRCRFKKTNDTTYREGLIKNVQYNRQSGLANITVIGE